MGKLLFLPWLCFSRCALLSQFRNLALSGLKILPVNPAFVSYGFPVPNGNRIDALEVRTLKGKKTASPKVRGAKWECEFVQWWVSLEKADIKSNFDLLPYLFWKPMVSVYVIAVLIKYRTVSWDFKIRRNDLFSNDGQLTDRFCPLHIFA